MKCAAKWTTKSTAKPIQTTHAVLSLDPRGHPKYTVIATTFTIMHEIVKAAKKA
jgi:hypothetical protein